MSPHKTAVSDATPCHQARASSDHEPSGVELLMCLAFIIFAISALLLLWDGLTESAVCWMANLVSAMRLR